MDRPARIALGEKRLQSVLKSHQIALARTLEQKIADAGPNPQRIDPHLLTTAREQLIEKGLLSDESSRMFLGFISAPLMLSSTPLEAVSRLWLAAALPTNLPNRRAGNHEAISTRLCGNHQITLKRRIGSGNPFSRWAPSSITLNLAAIEFLTTSDTMTDPPVAI